MDQDAHFEMMHVGGRFEVKGAVSLTLLRNLEHFMEAWSQMHPEYLNVVDIKPDRIIDDRNAPVDDSTVALFPRGWMRPSPCTGMRPHIGNRGMIPWM